MSRKLRILYAAGPGNVVGTYRHWAAGKDDPSQVAITYSAQFYELCRQIGASGYAISSNPKRQRIVGENLIVENRPARFLRGPGLLYHFGQIWYGLRLTTSALWFRADVAVVADGTHWFMLGLMSVLGVKVVPSLHRVLWPKDRMPTGFVQKFIWRLNTRFFHRRAFAVLSLPGELSDQGRTICGPGTTPIIPFVPTYRPESFDGIGAPPTDGPFNVLFAGRVERTKGIFDLLEIAKDFTASGRLDIEFDLCGDGSELEKLRQLVTEAGLQNRFRCHGHCTREKMREMYQRCHVVIVPTTSEIGEGFNKVVVEGVLAGRPVITSEACPAVDYVKESAIVASPNSAAAYAGAILLLKDDPTLYAAKRSNCPAVSAPFFDPTQSWKSALANAVQSL